MVDSQALFTLGHPGYLAVSVECTGRAVASGGKGGLWLRASVGLSTWLGAGLPFTLLRSALFICFYDIFQCAYIFRLCAFESSLVAVLDELRKRHFPLLLPMICE